MKKQKAISISIIETILVFICFYLFLFVVALGVSIGVSREFLDTTEIPISYVVAPVVAILLLNSLVIRIAKAERSILGLLDAKGEGKKTQTFSQRTMLVLSVSSLLFYALLCVFPEHVMFTWQRELLFTHVSCGVFLQRALFNLILGVCFFLIQLLTYRRLATQGASKTTNVDTIGVVLFKTALWLLLICAIYWFLGIVGPLFTLLIGGAVYMLIRMYYIPLTVIAVLLFFYAKRCIKAIRRRKAFFEKLEACCTSKKYVLSKPQYLCRSLWVKKGVLNFEITIQNKKYACLLFTTMRQKNKVVLKNDKISIVKEFGLFRTWFKLVSDIRLPSTDGTLILLSLPQVDHLYVADSVGTAVANLGEKYFDYLVYNEDILLGRLERNNLK